VAGIAIAKKISFECGELVSGRRVRASFRRARDRSLYVTRTWAGLGNVPAPSFQIHGRQATSL